MPLVSVVMPVYNGAAYVEAAVRSVLDQTMTDFELVVVDDGSRDESLAILERLADGDSRLRVEPLPTNRGHHVASNRALDLAGGELIVRHDQDDLLAPGWLDVATRFMGDHEDVGLLGGAHRSLIGDRVGELVVAPCRHTEMRAAMVFKMVFCHPGTVVRSTLRETGELEYHDFAGPQDYDLFSRLLDVTKGANLTEMAVLYRRHDATMSAHFESQMPSEVERISDRQLEDLLGPRTPHLDGRRAMRRLWRGQQVRRDDLRHVDLMRNVFERLREKPFVNADELDDVRRRWVQRIMSTSLRRLRRPPWRLMYAEPAAATRWLWSGLVGSVESRSSPTRSRGSEGDT